MGLDNGDPDPCKRAFIKIYIRDETDHFLCILRQILVVACMLLYLFIVHVFLGGRPRQQNNRKSQFYFLNL